MSVLTQEPTTTDGGAAFETLSAAYADRLASARQARERGIGVIGRIGNTVPMELVLAAGWQPVLVTADRGTPTPVADVYMEPVIAPETRSLFEQALSGTFEAFQLLVLSRPYAQLYYYLKEVFRLGRAPRLPRLWMYDLMQSQRDAVRAYNWDRTRALRGHLEALSGVELTEARLRSAISRTNAIRTLQRDLLDRRWHGEISGVDAMRAIGAGYFMAPDEYATALEDYLAQLTPDPTPRARARLLVLPSEPLAHTHLHQALEDAGARVVAEDDWYGSRAPGADIPRTGSALEGIFLKYWTDTATQHVNPAEAREAWFTAHAARPDVDGVVFYLPPSDHQLGWDYPRLRDWLDARGKAHVLVREDASQPEARTRITLQARAWLESVR